jgi:hypothetical protein
MEFKGEAISHADRVLLLRRMTAERLRVRDQDERSAGRVMTILEIQAGHLDMKYVNRWAKVLHIEDDLNRCISSAVSIK